LFCSANPVRNLFGKSPASESDADAFVMIWMMMAVHAIEHLESHAEKIRGRISIGGVLHRPSDRGVAQNMRRNICDLRVDRDPRKRLRHALDRLAGKLDHELLHGIQSTPSTEMDEEFELEYES
jgi:hypothetical protein